MARQHDPTDRMWAAGPLRILLISGSIREPSYSRILTDQVDTTLIALGTETTHWALRTRPLPIADPRFHHNPAVHPDEAVRSLVAQAESADAFVVATPIYHNSYSGALKNALDHLTIAQVHYKPVGLISHGGHRSTQAVEQLRLVVRGLLGVAIPAQVCTAEQDFDAVTYQLSNSDILGRITRFASELILFASQLRLVRQAAFGMGAAASARRVSDALSGESSHAIPASFSG